MLNRYKEMQYDLSFCVFLLRFYRVVMPSHTEFFFFYPDDDRLTGRMVIPKGKKENGLISCL